MSSLYLPFISTAGLKPPLIPSNTTDTQSSAVTCDGIPFAFPFFKSRKIIPAPGRFASWLRFHESKVKNTQRIQANTDKIIHLKDINEVMPWIKSSMWEEKTTHCCLSALNMSPLHTFHLRVTPSSTFYPTPERAPPETLLQG